MRFVIIYFFIALSGSLRTSFVQDVNIDIEEKDLAHTHTPPSHSSSAEPYIDPVLAARHPEGDKNTWTDINPRRGEGLPYKETDSPPLPGH